MNIPGSEGFWAAIIGAIIGGFIAALTQWFFAWSQRKQKERALATSLLLKLGKLTSTLMVTKQHVDDCFVEAGEVGPDTQPWQILIPISSSSRTRLRGVRAPMMRVAFSRSVGACSMMSRSTAKLKTRRAYESRWCAADSVRILPGRFDFFDLRASSAAMTSRRVIDAMGLSIHCGTSRLSRRSSSPG